jgi:hypothetical protein
MFAAVELLAMRQWYDIASAKLVRLSPTAGGQRQKCLPSSTVCGQFDL